MTALSSCTLVCILSACITLLLEGCGGGTPAPGPPGPGPPGPPTPGPPAGPCQTVPNCNKCDDGTNCDKCNDGFQPMGTPTQCMYSCTSDLTFPVVKPEKKGLCLDDTTHHWCTDKIHSQWPNTKNTMVSAIRINKAWEIDWTTMDKEKAWDSIAAYLHASGAKALVGTSLTCDRSADESDWKDVQALLKKIGPEHVLGVAVGNELELLQNKDDSAKGTFPSMKACCIDMWNDGGYLETSLTSRIADLDALGSEWQNVKVTSVFGAAILYEGNPFREQPQARVNTFFKNIIKKFPKRYVFSFNIYPYFDTGNHFDAGARTCKEAIARSVCFDKPNCLMNIELAHTRQQQLAFDNMNPGLNMQGLEFWITETGWSAPTAKTLEGQNPDMVQCAEYSSYESLAKYYKNFLNWDMTVQGVKGPDRAFWFTMRDAPNFGQLEHFGIGGSGPHGETLCSNNTCKLQSHYGSGTSEAYVV